MDVIWQTLLFRLAEHAQVVLPIIIATGVLGLGPIGRAIARRLSGPALQELESLREQLAELQERADYNERILGALRNQPSSSVPLPPPPIKE